MHARLSSTFFKILQNLIPQDSCIAIFRSLHYNRPKWRCCGLKLKQNPSGCVIDANSRWGNYAAACMGGAFFLRMVHYFGLVNLRDVSGFEIAFGLVLPLLLSAALILVLKLPGLNIPIVTAGLAAAGAVSYFFTAQMNAGGIISGILQLATAVLLVLACLGYLPRAEYAVIAGFVTLVFRVLVVDLFGFILPLAEFAPAAYVSQCANLFSLAALAMLCPALRQAEAAAAPAGDGLSPADGLMVTE